MDYIDGDYSDPATSRSYAGNWATRSSRRTISPSRPAVFETVIPRLGESGSRRARAIVIEKPFGKDLATAKRLNAVVHSVFREENVFRIDHYLGKNASSKPAFFPLCQFFSRASVESAVRGKRPDHDGGKTSVSRVAAIFTTSRARARRRAEPSAASSDAILRWSLRLAWMSRCCATKKPRC